MQWPEDRQYHSTNTADLNAQKCCLNAQQHCLCAHISSPQPPYTIKLVLYLILLLSLLAGYIMTPHTSLLKPNIIKTNCVQFYLYHLVQLILNNLNDKIQIRKIYVLLLLCRHSPWSSLGLTGNNNSQWYRHVKTLTMYNNKKGFIYWFLLFLHLPYLHNMFLTHYDCEYHKLSVQHK